MEIKITINEKQIQEIAEDTIARELAMEYGGIARDAKGGIRDGVDKAIKAYIYSRKEEIIERCINRATAELVRKGLPKLLEREIKP